MSIRIFLYFFPIIFHIIYTVCMRTVDHIFVVVVVQTQFYAPMEAIGKTPPEIGTSDNNNKDEDSGLHVSGVNNNGNP